MSPFRVSIRHALFPLAALAVAAAVPAIAAVPAQAAVAPGPVPDCGGQVVLKPDGTPWTCSFDDEFDVDGAPDPSLWTVQQTSNSGYTTGPKSPAGLQACYENDPDDVSVSNGALHLSAVAEAAPFTCASPSGAFSTSYTAGQVSTKNSFSQTYGLYSVRARLPQVAVNGVQETFWLWPTDSVRYGAYPTTGEIDFAEFYSQYYTRVVPYLHYLYYWNTVSPSANANIVTSSNCFLDPTVFHDYTLDWEPGTMTISVDNKTCLIDHYTPAAPLVSPQPFDQPFFLTLTQALGVGTNAFDPATTPLPATTDVDWVRVWK